MTSVDEIRRRLKPDKHRLDDELELQPEVAYTLSRMVAQASSRADAAKDDLRVLEARLAHELRTGVEKITDKAVESAVLRDPERRTSFREWLRLKQEVDELVGLEAAWRSRGFSLAGLTSLHGQDYFAQASRSYRERPSYDAARTERSYRQAVASRQATGGRQRVRVEP